MGVRRPQAIPLARLARSRFSLRTFGAALALAGLLILVAGWFPSPVAEPSGGIYREGVVGALPPLDPLAAHAAPIDPDVTPLLYRGLVDVDAHGLAHPGLAERWSTSAEDRIYWFVLRSGLHWDDGEPLTSADVLFSIERAAGTPEADGTPSFWASVDTWAVDDETIEVMLREPLGAFLERAALPIVAAHAPPGSARPASNGPYAIAEVSPSAVVLERNSAYGGPAPAIDRVEIRLLEGREAALQALLAGQIDGLAGLTPAERGALASAEGVEVYDVPEYGKYGLLVLNAQQGVFRDRRARQAAARALSRQALVASTLQGQGEPAAGPISPLSWALDPSVEYADYDPAAARALLEQVGQQPADGGESAPQAIAPPTVTLLTSNARPRGQEAAEVGRQLRAVGFEVNVLALPPEMLLRDHLKTGDFSAALIGRWLPEVDPDQFALWHSTQAHGLGANYGGINSPELDHWLELGRRETSVEARGPAYREFQRVWAAEQPGLLLYYPHTAYALNRELRGVPADPLPDASWRLRSLPGWSWASERAPTGWSWPFKR